MGSSIIILTVPGLRGLHPRPHPQLRSASTTHIPLLPPLAQHQHNRRQSSHDVATGLATLHITNPLSTSPNNTPRIPDSPLTHNIPRPPFAHLPLLRHAPPFNTLLHNDIPPLHPHRLPRPHQILRRLLRPLLPPKIQKIPRFARRRTQRSGKKSAQDIGVPNRRHRHQLGLHLPLPTPLPALFPPLRTLVPRWLPRRSVGLRGSERGQGTFLV